MPSKKDDTDSSLRRLGGGRWQTRDERFTIEPQSGTWAVVDAQHTDELGLPRVRGPFPSLRAAKEAIGDIREGPPEASPLAGRVAPRARSRSAKAGETTPSAQRRESTVEVPEPEPAWLAKLSESQRGEARRLIRDLEAADLPDPIGLTRRDIVDHQPTVARALLLRRLATLVLRERDDPDRLAGELVALLTTRTRDADSPLRLPGWRFVEDTEAARRIEITRRDLQGEIERLERASGKGAGRRKA